MTPAEQRQLTAYLNGELDAAGIEAFEILLLQRPDLAEQVDADTMLGMAFKKYANSLPEQPVASSRPATSGLMADARRCWLPLSIAASLALLVGMAAGYLIPKTFGAAESVSVAYVDQMRGAGTTTDIALPNDGALVLMAPVASAEPCVATLTLDQAGTQVAINRSLSDRLGYAGLLVDAHSVHEGDATIGIACNGQAPMRYPVHLRRVASLAAAAGTALHRS